MTTSKSSDRGESTNRPAQVSASLPPGPLPNKMLHKLGRTDTQTSPYGTGQISTTPTTARGTNPSGH